MINCKLIDIFKTSFNGLWQCKTLENDSLEITTPYLFFDRKFVTFIVKMQGDEYVVHDNGLVNDLLANKKAEKADSYLSIACDTLRIDRLHQNKGFFLYKKTSDSKMLSAIAFDLVQAMSQVINTYQLIKEKEDFLHPDGDEKDAFFKRTTGDLKRTFKDNFYVNAQPRTHKQFFDVLIYTAASKELSQIKFIPIEILSRTRPSDFDSQLTKAVLKFQGSEKWSDVITRYTLLNKHCDGYNKESRDFKRDNAEIELSRLSTVIDDNQWDEGNGIAKIKAAYEKA